MLENNTEKEIEKWYVTHMKNNFLYYLLFGIFVTIFAYVFCVKINMHSLSWLLLYSFVPSFLVTLFSFLLLRGYFLIFFGLTILITPALVTVFILFTFKTSTSPSIGYVLYTNNLTDKCSLKVLDYKEGVPWFATKGCFLTEESKPMIQKFIKAGGSNMRWQNTCQMLRFSSNSLIKEYDKILEKNPSFDIFNAIENKLSYATTTGEFLFIERLQLFQRTSSQYLSYFRDDVPGKSESKILTEHDVLDLCSIKHLEIYGY